MVFTKMLKQQLLKQEGRLLEGDGVGSLRQLEVKFS